MAGQDEDHILQLINQNEERNRQAFNSSHNQFSNHASPFSVVGRISSLADFDFRTSPVINTQSGQTNLNQTSGMLNPTTFNSVAANHQHHLKAASQAQPPMMQNNNHNHNHTINNNNNPNSNSDAVVAAAAAAAYHHHHHHHHIQMAHTHDGHSNQINPGHHYSSAMNPNHQLLSGQIPIPNSMAPQTSRLVNGTMSANQLSVSGNLFIPTSGAASFMSVNGQSNSFRPAGSEVSSQKKSSSASASSKNGESPRRTFACPTCAKGFTEKFNMKRHMQIHSQSRPKYICNECSKSFAWKDNFIRHKKAAHGTNSIQYHV